jgi:fatty-acyl-CoA synthase
LITQRHKTLHGKAQYIQALVAVGAGTGAAVALLSLNRPEVLMMAGASQVEGFRRTPLHPLGSLEDHAYAVSDAGVTTLVIDPNPMFVERARRLVDKVDSLNQILTIGPVPAELSDVGTDIAAAAAGFSPRPLVAADLRPDHVSVRSMRGHMRSAPGSRPADARSGRRPGIGPLGCRGHRPSRHGRVCDQHAHLGPRSQCAAMRR